MSAASMSIVRVAADGWSLWDGQCWAECAPYPTLTASAWCWIDHADWPTALWRFDGQASHARAYVERRVRQEGLLAEAAHIQLHRVMGVRGGGFEAWFTAVPLEEWMRLQRWSRQSEVHVLPVFTAGLMAAHLRAPGMCVWRVDTRWLAAIRGRQGWSWSENRAFGRDPEALTQSLRALLADVPWGKSHGESTSVYLATLWADDKRPIESLWSSAGAPTEGVRVRVEPTRPFALADGSVGQWCAAELLNRLGDRALVAGGLTRAAWAAQRWAPALAGLMVMAAGGTWGLGAWASHEARALQAQTARLRTEVEQRQKTLEMTARWRPSPEWSEAAERAQRLAQALDHDPVRFLRLLQRHTDPAIVIQRVHLNTSGKGLQGFQVEGRMPLGRPDLAPAWLARMRQAGWQASAAVAAVAEPGAFAWLFTPVSVVAQEVGS